MGDPSPALQEHRSKPTEDYPEEASILSKYWSSFELAPLSELLKGYLLAVGYNCAPIPAADLTKLG